MNLVVSVDSYGNVLSSFSFITAEGHPAEAGISCTESQEQKNHLIGAEH